MLSHIFTITHNSHTPSYAVTGLLPQKLMLSLFYCSQWQQPVPLAQLVRADGS